MTREETIADLRKQIDQIDSIERPGLPHSMINRLCRQRRVLREKLAALGVEVPARKLQVSAADVLRKTLGDQAMTARRLAYIAKVDISNVNVMIYKRELVVVGRAPLEPGQMRFAKRQPIVALPEHADKHRSAA